MHRPPRHGGAVALLVAIFLLAILASLAAIGRGALAGDAARERATERALAQAREALIAYAAERPIDAQVGPGYLPCPDADDDGWAESTCGSLSGSLGQAERLGRLPWKTLGLPDLRDGWGERLWYAVSTRHKGLLNCAASRDCRDMSPPAALGTITVRDASGAVVQDGTIADPARADAGGAAAVVIAPGPPLTRHDGREQRRDCAPGDCDAAGRCVASPPRRAARCDPANYLDIAPPRAGAEDNAAFVDRTDARAGNADGFIQGPVASPAGGAAVNDRVAAVTYAQLMPRVLARVAHELAFCVAAAPSPPDATCGIGVGRVSDAALALAACNASATEPTWWTPWRPHVLYAASPDGRIEVTDAQGRPVATRRRLAILATQRAGDCAEGRVTCEAGGCTRVALRPPEPGRHEALASLP